MCDGRLFASSPFCRLACRGALFRGFPFRWVLHFVLSLTRGVVLHDSAPYSREDSLGQCGRPCDTLSCLLFSALWLRCNQSILVQETQSVFSKQNYREFKLKYLKKLFDNNNILCLHEVHGKDEYLQAIQVLAPRFRFFGTFLLKTKTREDRLSAFTRTFFLKRRL